MTSLSLPFKHGDKLVELGGGLNPIIRPNFDLRDLPTVDFVVDFDKILPIPDNSYNGIFSSYLIEHLGWRNVGNFIKESLRILAPGGIAVFITANLLNQCKRVVNCTNLKEWYEFNSLIFGGQDYPENTHKNGFSPDYAIKIFKEAGFEKVEIFDHPQSKTDMIIQATKSSISTEIDASKKQLIMDAEITKEYPSNPSSNPSSKSNPIKEDTINNNNNNNNSVKVNVGSFTIMSPKDWENWDIIDLNKWASDNGFYFKQVDIRQRLPKDDNSVGLISCSHTLEHLTREEGKRFLLETYRILMPGGIIRITVPDPVIITQDYLKGNISRHGSHNEDIRNSPDDAHSLFHLLFGHHHSLYDEIALTKILRGIGFISIKKQEYKKSYSKELEIDSANVFPIISLYLEAVKPLEQENQTDPIITYGAFNHKGIEASKDAEASKNKLNIALISTPFFGCPPISYGGLEQVIWDLACGLDELGHSVTIFAPEGSKKPRHGNLITIGPSINTVGVDWLAEEKKTYDIYKKYITHEKFDIVHGNGWFGFEYLLKINNPILNICHLHHGGYQWTTYPPVTNGKANLIAMSDFMRQYTITYFKQKGFNIGCERVYHGINTNKYSFQDKSNKSNNLLFVGRYSDFKRPDIAIEIAKLTNHEIDLIGGSFVDDPNYLKKIESMCDSVNTGIGKIRMWKDVNHEFKIKKMQDAKTILIPSQMNEPLNLVSLEGQSCGTPIICTKDGGLPETIIHGKTGFICDNINQMIESVGKINTIKPEDCRKNVEENFSRIVMAKNYESLYYKILNRYEW